jgi:hypothetical protein
MPYVWRANQQNTNWNDSMRLARAKRQRILGAWWVHRGMSFKSVFPGEMPNPVNKVCCPAIAQGRKT